MQLKQYTFACLITAMVMALELVAATTGEALAALTVLSALPIYVLGRERVANALLSYTSVTLLLLAVNPHQCLFFVGTNGLLGLALGISHQKIAGKLTASLVSGLALFFGTVATAFVLGFLVAWWIPVVLFPFCLLYTALYGFIAGKLYAKLQRARGSRH